jgi:hypothetical protein
MQEIFVIPVHLVISLTQTIIMLVKLAQPSEEQDAYNAQVQLAFFVKLAILELLVLLA